MFFAVVIKDPNKAEEENEQEANELNPDEETIHNKTQNSEEEKTLRKIGFVDKPPNEEKLEYARRLKVKQKAMKVIIREIVQYFVFLSVLLVVAYGSRDPMGFQVTSAMRNIFEDGKYTGLGAFDEVKIISLFFLLTFSVFKLLYVNSLMVWCHCCFVASCNFYNYFFYSAFRSSVTKP